VKFNNTDACDLLSGQEQLECYNAVSTILEDVHVCDAFQDPHNKGYCYYLYAYTFEDHNAEICDGLNNEEKYFCYIYSAKSFRNEFICNKLTNFDDREACLALRDIDWRLLKDN